MRGCRLCSFKCENEGAYLAYVTEIRDTQKGRKMRPSLRLVVEVRGVEPRSNRPLTVLSTCLAGVWVSLASVRRRTSARQARDDSDLTGRWGRVVCFYDAACSGNRKPEGDTLTKLSSEGELHGGVLLRIFRVYFLFPFLRRRACGMLTQPAACLPRLKPTVEAGTPPRRRVTRRR